MFTIYCIVNNNGELYPTLEQVAEVKDWNQIRYYQRQSNATTYLKHRLPRREQASDNNWRVLELQFNPVFGLTKPDNTYVSYRNQSTVM